MTVFRNRGRGNRWSYHFELGKKRYQGYCIDPDTGLDATSERQAREIEALRKRAIRQELNLAKSGVKAGAFTLNQAAVIHLQAKQENDPEDFANAKLYVREILGVLGGSTPLASLTNDDAARYRRHATAQTLKVWIGGPKRKRDAPGAERYWKETGRPRSKRQVNNYLKCLRALFAIGEKTRDPVTRLPVVDIVPEIKLYKLPKRLPRPISDDELQARTDQAPPWTREAAELARLFGLRLSEATTVQLRHVAPETGGLRFDAGETKSRNDELVHGGAAGRQLLEELSAQAIERGVAHLVTWPGPKHFRRVLAGDMPEDVVWRPLKSVARSWRAAARRAGVDRPSRFHDIRARFVTEVAKVQPAAAQDAARHQDPATTALYIKLAASEIRDAVDQANARRPKAAPTRRFKVVK